MSIYLGIDLGSTTTKAILLDENEKILGRGITNTRSDYHVATAVAENEARINARFTLLHRSMEKEHLDTGLLQVLEDHLGRQSFLFRLRRLRQYAMEFVDGTPPASRADAAPSTGAGCAPGTTRLALRQALETIFDGMESEFAGDPGSAARLRKSFFRDIAGTAFMSRAEVEAGGGDIEFESLMGVFDKVILQEENAVLDIDFAETLSGCPAATAAGNSDAGRLRRAIEAAATATLETENTVGTGYGRQRLPFRDDQIRSEILCHGLGAHYFFPRTRTVLDIGGQDTKAIQVDPNGIATNFQMNDRCAAGCGRYLGYIADELNISLDDLGPLALQAKNYVSVSSTCTVFAGAELRERLELGEKREEILAGLHRAIILRAMSLLARSGGIHNDFTFTGGVARNPAAVKALREVTDTSYGERTLNIHPDSIYTGAVGAALYAHRDLPGGGPELEPIR